MAKRFISNISNQDAFLPGRRKMFLAGAAGLIIPLIPKSVFAATIVAVRMWPSEDYTRVTLELDKELHTEQFVLTDPHRLVVDIHDVDLNPTLEALVTKLKADDPYISAMRIAQNRPNVVRIVIDLKQEIKPQIFTLRPVGNYQYRLVLDLYPTVAADPLLALLKEDSSGNIRTEPDELTQFIEELEQNRPAEPNNNKSPLIESPSKPLTPNTGRKMITIALDPGHGGEDPGAIGSRGNKEKDVVLKIARILKRQIDDQPNMRAMLTRDADFFVPLKGRVDKARRVQADLFVSIHADAWIKPSANGSSVFALSDKGATSTAAKWLADKENAADLIGGVNISSHDAQIAKVILDLSTTAQINDSLKVGSSVLREIGDINRLHKGSVEQANFAVLKAPDIPSILVETAFISNPEEEAKLSNPSYQEKMANAILKGIIRHFDKHPPRSNMA